MSSSSLFDLLSSLAKRNIDEVKENDEVATRLPYCNKKCLQPLFMKTGYISFNERYRKGERKKRSEDLKLIDCFKIIFKIWHKKFNSFTHAQVLNKREKTNLQFRLLKSDSPTNYLYTIDIELQKNRKNTSDLCEEDEIKHTNRKDLQWTWPTDRPTSHVVNSLNAFHLVAVKPVNTSSKRFL